MHVQHGVEGLQVCAARIENDAFTDEAQVRFVCLFSRPVFDMQDRRAIIFISLCDSKKSAGAHFLKFVNAVLPELPATSRRQLLAQLNIGNRIQFVRWHGGEPARQIIAGRFRDGAAQVNFLRQIQNSN